MSRPARPSPRRSPGLDRLATTVALLGAGLAAAALLNAARNRARLAAPVAAAPVAEPVSVLIPARNEQDTLPALLGDVTGQQHLARLEVLVCDDESTDATAAAVIAAAQRDPRIILHPGSSPPSGWLGKPWALEQLLTRAGGSVIVLLDADTRLAPDALSRAIGSLRTDGLGLVSPYPQILADWRRDGVLAGLVQPLLAWSWFSLLPLDALTRSRRRSLTAVGGQFLVCDARALRSVDGFRVVAGDVLDDIGLARALKAAGHRIALINGSDIATCRMYRCDADLVEGYTKSLWRALGGPWGTLGATGLLFLAYLAPPLLALLRPRRSTVLAGVASFLAGTGSRVLAARATRGRAWPDSLTHPAGVGAVIGLALTSLVRRHRGTTRWRGRVIP